MQMPDDICDKMARWSEVIDIDEMKRHPDYEDGYYCGINAEDEPEIQSEVFKAGIAAGRRAADAFLNNGFKRFDGGFALVLGPTKH